MDALRKEAIESVQALEKEKAKGFVAGGVNAKAEKAAQKEAAERERLVERLAAMQEKHYLATLTKEQQITELHRRRAELGAWLADNWSKLSEQGRLKAEIDVEELKGEEEATQRGLDKPHQRHGEGPTVNSLQAIGAFSASASLVERGLAVQERTEHILTKVESHLQEIKNRGHGQHGVHF